MEYILLMPNDFPNKLKMIKKAPKKLYAKGNINLLYQDSFAIVGTRNPTEYGEKVTKIFSKEFALRDIPIVSGMANGIDEMAHQSVLEYQGKTIAVLGCRLEYYEKYGENKKIFTKILENKGLILSEYELREEGSKENFPKRNRIIAALSEGVLVIEAAFRSGSSITAKYVNEYGKIVFCIPGRIDSKKSVGTNILIKKGGILTTSIEDILSCYPQFADKKRKSICKNLKKEFVKKIREEWKEIYDILKEGECSLENLQIKTQKDIRTLIKIVSEMEIEGVIEQEIGIGYKLKK